MMLVWIALLLVGAYMMINATEIEPAMPGLLLFIMGMTVCVLSLTSIIKLLWWP